MILELVAYTATTDLHSGHFGNFAPNAAQRLAALLASMKDDDGRVTIATFYDQVTALSPTEREALRKIPRVEPEMAERFGIGRPDGSGRPLQELLNLPTLNVRGLRSGHVGDAARNLIPHHAVAELDLRLVAGMSVEHTLGAITAHIERQGWTVFRGSPTREQLRGAGKAVQLSLRSGFTATRTPLDAAIARRVRAAVERASREDVLTIPTEVGAWRWDTSVCRSSGCLRRTSTAISTPPTKIWCWAVCFER